MIVRTLTVFEQDAASKQCLALSPGDRRKRFCRALSDESVSKHVDGLNFARHTILGAFDEQARIIGLAGGPLRASRTARLGRECRNHDNYVR